MRVKRFDILWRPGLEAGSLARLPASPLPSLLPPACPAREDSGCTSAPPERSQVTATGLPRRPPPPSGRSPHRKCHPSQSLLPSRIAPPRPLPTLLQKVRVSLRCACLSPFVFKGVARKLSCFFFFFYNYIMSGIVFLFSPEERSQKK